MNSFCPTTTGGFVAWAQGSGTGRSDAATPGSIRTMATSRTGSAAAMRPATLSEDESCTSTDAAIPTARWFVAMSPRASITNPEA